MLKIIDDFLNSITMYRLVLYSLLVIGFTAVIFGFLGIIPYTGQQQLISGMVIILTCQISNYIFSKIFKAPANSESALITALILFLILNPTNTISGLKIICVAGLIAMASKYIFAIQKKHIFNPTAITLVILGLFGSGEAIWWVATISLLPFVTIVGLFIIRKIRQSLFFFSFFISSLIFILLFGFINKSNSTDSFIQIFTSWPLIFFGAIMLTEPMTTPPKKSSRIIYGVIVGVLFGSQFHIGPFYSTPELALIIGNIFSYIVSPKIKLQLKLKEKIKLGFDMYEFIFKTNKPLTFQPGQYLEWTFAHKGTDNRGNRRYFTIASSPTEKEIKLGVRIDQEHSSSFKRALFSMKKDDEVFGSQLGGDFTLPKNLSQKLVFIAGGIGITPFRSMIKYLIDKNEKRDIVLFYVAPSEDAFVYKNILNKIKTIYVITRSNNIPEGWTGKVGYISEQMIKEEVPDYSERKFYLSGPNKMVKLYQDMLSKLKIDRKNIITDYFPGF